MMPCRGNSHRFVGRHTKHDATEDACSTNSFCLETPPGVRLASPSPPDVDQRLEDLLVGMLDIGNLIPRGDFENVKKLLKSTAFIEATGSIVQDMRSHEASAQRSLPPMTMQCCRASLTENINVNTSKQHGR